MQLAAKMPLLFVGCFRDRSLQPLPLYDVTELDYPQVCEITDRIVRQYLEPLVQDGIDTLVLGCTHYPLLRAAISRFLGDTVKLVDSAQNCATAVRDLLGAETLRTTQGAEGNLEVALTDPPDAFLDVARHALRLEIGNVLLREVIHPARS